MMRKLTNIDDVIRHGLCISCGACVSAAPEGTVEIISDETRGIYVPQWNLDYTATAGGAAFKVCPGKGLPIETMARELFGETPQQSYALGRYRSFMAARSTEDDIHTHASSGGVITAIAAHLLESGTVEGVTVSRFKYGAPGPRVESFIARSREDLISAQGSKYCPTITNAIIRECHQQGGAYLFSGTPCQVAALRLAQDHDPALKELFPLSVANFCGGYRDYRHLDGMIRYDGVDPSEVTAFRFRGGGQPGSMKFETQDDRTLTAPYPQYNARTRITKQKRCVYCIDATGELADFSCGDAWLDRLQTTDQSWSIILGRSEQAVRVLDEMTAQGKLAATEVTEDEICQSQRQNLASKKYRQHKRRQLSHCFGIVMPTWDVDLVNEGSYWEELLTLFGKTWLGLKWLGVKRFLKGRLMLVI